MVSSSYTIGASDDSIVHALPAHLIDLYIAWLKRCDLVADPKCFEGMLGLGFASPVRSNSYREKTI